MNIAIVGGGIIGLATAYKAQEKYPQAKIILFEKEDEVGLHQSSRNSGVLHCGLYYKPGSLKAKLAVSGIRQMTKFCLDHNLPHDICGKIVVATDEREISLMRDLAKRGEENGLSGLKILDKSEILKREPFVNALKALLVPQEGIVDYKEVMNKLASIIESKEGVIKTGAVILGSVEKNNKVILKTAEGEIEFDHIYYCSGLFSDRLYEKVTGKSSPVKIIPFRGDYYKIKSDRDALVNHLIYPVPDPKYPFLGVHFTRLMKGGREVGPNAVLAFKREGYSFTDFSLKDTLDTLSYGGFQKFIINNFSFTLSELISSLSKSKFLAKAKKMIPDVELDDLEKGTSGVRAQAIDKSGKLVMDFIIEKRGRETFLLNAPSPGATASLAIADYLISN
ncbi:MAG: L-2-hydroxyglutarate oxidase [Melioribacteraceae bacterium]|jgi:L-2-hydroxyglutarate oxidase|nr:L-2-hydroxyglutarate oxidase [Melioribacteraceae bacterium]